MKPTNEASGDNVSNHKAGAASVVKKLRGPVMLFIAALVWGAAFVAQSMGMDYVDPITFNGVRCFIGAAGLMAAIIPLDRLKVSAPPQGKEERRLLLRNGTICLDFIRRLYHSANRLEVYHGRKSGLYNRALYRHGSAARHIFGQASSMADMGRGRRRRLRLLYALRKR